eukprot:Hpha_TRINITY_DN15878_c1_g8::TRINITY_DN15878_c1_g8_i1::g.191553::m.191553
MADLKVPRHVTLDLQIAAGEQGLGIGFCGNLVVLLQPGTAAHRAGVKPGWTVVSVDGVAVHRHSEVREALSKSTAGCRVCFDTLPQESQRRRGPSLSPFTSPATDEQRSHRSRVTTNYSVAEPSPPPRLSELTRGGRVAARVISPPRISEAGGRFSHEKDDEVLRLEDDLRQKDSVIQSLQATLQEKNRKMLEYQTTLMQNEVQELEESRRSDLEATQKPRKLGAEPSMISLVSQEEEEQVEMAATLKRVLSDAEASEAELRESCADLRVQLVDHRVQAARARLPCKGIGRQCLINCCFWGMIVIVGCV